MGSPQRAPYASTGSVLTVIEKHRQVGLQSMSRQRLQQIGVSEALAPRTLQTLTFLGFYDDNGSVTAEFDALRKVPGHDFRPRLAALLREAYAQVLEVLDPATCSPQDVENAFRGFEPTGQLPRMVQLFMGLMIYAGVMPEGQRRQPPGMGSTRDSKPSAPKASRQNGDAGNGRPVALETPPAPKDDPSGGERFSQVDGDTYVLYLASGPKVVLSVKMDVMRVSKADRAFIFSLVDSLRDYVGDDESGSAAAIAETIGVRSP